jgi:ATP-dependent protease ClpP protease subunit
LSQDIPRPWYRIENSANAAEVYIYDEISPYGVTANDFVRDLNSIARPTINLHLNTPGGDVFDGIAIFNALKAHSAFVNVYIPGLAASIGTVIAMAADRIVIAPHARMMIHEAHALGRGNATDFAKMSERLNATSDNIASIYAERAGGDVAAWRELMRSETWYTDEAAVTAGLADEVGRSNDESALKQAASFDLSIYREGERIAALLRAEVVEDAPAEPSEDEPAPPDTAPTRDERDDSNDGEEPSDPLVALARIREEERRDLELRLSLVKL